MSIVCSSIIPPNHLQMELVVPSCRAKNSINSIVRCRWRLKVRSISFTVLTPASIKRVRSALTRSTGGSAWWIPTPTCNRHNGKGSLAKTHNMMIRWRRGIDPDKERGSVQDPGCPWRRSHYPVAVSPKGQSINCCRFRLPTGQIMQKLAEGPPLSADNIISAAGCRKSVAHLQSFRPQGSPRSPASPFSLVPPVPTKG